jgi:hypothetical protein
MADPSTITGTITGAITGNGNRRIESPEHRLRAFSVAVMGRSGPARRRSRGLTRFSERGDEIFLAGTGKFFLRSFEIGDARRDLFAIARRIAVFNVSFFGHADPFLMIFTR